MEDLHRLLQRQIRNSGIDLEAHPELQNLISNVNKTYHHLEKENKILEHNSKVILESLTINKANLQNTVESLDSFNYHVSHDLKTILVNNISFLKMLKKYRIKRDEEKIEDLIFRLNKNAEKGMRLVEKYLQISKFETLGADEDLNEVNIEQSVNEVLDLTDLKGKIDVQLDLKDFTSLRIKESYLNSIFQNLVTNSYKYSREEVAPKVDIRTRIINAEKILEFQDNGLGIDLDKNAKKMFKPFVRLKNSKNQEGTGVGLFMIKKIINQLNGRIEIESELGEGTLFRLIF